MSDDITDQAERVLRLRWEQPGPDYPEPVPTGLVWLGDWASEHLGELVAELKTTRAELNQAVADWGANDEMVLAENHRLAEELKTTRAQLEQRRIETVEQLKALKPRPDLINGVLIRAIGAPSFGAVFELNDDGTWNDFDATTPAGKRTAPEDVPLPAFILWEPQETRVDRPRARPRRHHARH